ARANSVLVALAGSAPGGGTVIPPHAGGVPVGATLPPPLPTSAVSPATVSSNFSWTPTQSQVGTYVVQFSVIDQDSQQTLCSTTITVQCNSALCDDSNGCTDDACSSPSGQCVFTPNTASCDDGDPRTVDAVCSGGSCQGTGTTCNDNSPCTDDSCAGGTCTHTNNTATCDDGNACTVGDVCSGGSCQPGPLKDCADTNPC